MATTLLPFIKVTKRHQVLCRLGLHRWISCGHPTSWSIVNRVCRRCRRHEHVRFGGDR